MSVAKVLEITATSDQSFEDAVRQGIAKASETVRNIKGAWVKEQNVTIDNGEITGFRVDLKVTFVLD
jgi:flavin-binding protein dodecin